jgi:hypothetical protein
VKRPDKVSLIAVYHWIMAVPFVLASLILMFAYLPVLLSVQAPDVVWPIFGISLELFFTGLFAILFIVIGFGLWRLQNWARWAAIVLAVLLLPGFPIWTAIGALIIIYLVSDEAKAAFGASV